MTSSPNSAMSTPEKELELIAATAALYRPTQIHGKLSLLLNALLFQHECVLTDLINDPDRQEMLAMFHSFSGDVRSIELMLKILHTVEPDFERGSVSSAKEVLELSKERLVEDSLVDQKQQLENLLNDN